MNRALYMLYIHIGYIGPGEPPEDGEMIEMTLSSRHRIRNLTEVEHATSRSWRLPTILTFTRGWGRNIFCSFKTAETGNRTPNSGVKGSGANHHGKLGCVYAVTITVLPILLLREGNFQAIVILK